MTNSTSVGRGGARARRAFLRVTTILCSGLVPAIVAVPAVAQVAPPPVRQAIDGNGVDLFLGTMNVNGPTMSAGSAGQGIVYYRLTRGSGWLDNVLAAASGNGSTITVTFNGYSDSFTQSGSTFTSTEANGAKLVISGNIYTYTARDGTIVNFDTSQQGSALGQSQLGAATSIIRGNGEILALNNVRMPVCYYWVQSNNACTPSAVGYLYRLSSTTSSNGYKLSFSYANDYPHSTSDVPLFYTLASTVLSNSKTNVTLKTQNYGAQSGGLTISSTRGAIYSGDVNGVTKITNGVSSDVSIAYLNGKVYTVTNATGTTTYSFTDSGNIRTTSVTDQLGHTNTYLFNISLQRPVSITYAVGKTTTLAYDAQARLTSKTAPDQNSVSYTYDTNGNITQTQMTPKPGSGLSVLSTSALYPCSTPATCGSPTWTKDAKGNQTDYTYDPATGNLLTVQAPALSSGGRPTTSYSYTTVNGAQILSSTSTCATASTCVGTASETKTSISYNANGLPITTTVQAGDGSVVSTVTKTYDDAGNVTSVDGPMLGNADTITYRYDTDRDVVGAIAPDPDDAGPLKRRAQRNTYDAIGRVTLSEQGTVTDTTDAAWNAFASQQQVAITYDGMDRPLTTTETGLGTTYGVTQNSYDHQRLDCTAQRLNSAAWGSLPLSACTAQTTGGSGPDRISKLTYDNADRQIKVTSAYGTADQADDGAITYTNDGQTATATDANGNVTSYGYDGFDRLMTTTFPSTTKGAGTSNPSDYEQLSYDANGNVIGRRLRDGTSVGYTYDALNRVILKDLPGSQPDAAYTYDLLGRPLTVAVTGQTLSFTWDALGRNLTQTSPQGTVTAGYDLGDKRTQLTYPGGTFYVTYAYDAAGNMTAIKESGTTTLASFAYDDLGRRTTLTRGSGVVTSYSYDAASRPTSLAVSGASDNLVLGFSYNPASQISSTTRSNNTFAWTGAVTVNRGYGSNGLNQYNLSGSTSLGYDLRGNLTTSGSTTYNYTSENLLSAGSDAAAILSYDPMLRLSQTSATGYATTRFAYDGQSMIGEYDVSGNLLKRYVFGPGADEPLVEYDASGIKTYLVADERGSVIARTNSSGTVTAKNTYDEYGIPGSGNVGRFQYTGQAWLPELGMQYSKARLYSPSLGRFMQTDPIGYGDGMNWYNYVGGDPVNATDPTGLCDGNEQGCNIYVTGSSAYCPTGTTLTNQGCISFANLYQQQRAGYSASGSVGAAPGPVAPQKDLVCKGTATFSAVGPLPQAAGDSAFAPGTKPADGTVAIAGAQTFGFGRRALRQGAAAGIQISPEGLDDLLRSTGGPQPPYSVGDYGDANIRNAPGSRFDIYRFSTMKGAKTFGKRTVPVTITVPAGGHCPPGTSAQ